ncbi:sensor histidine kinase [Paenibacillus koleovorans]|uniref:sensor histidine kinase n=1 Tax=Paenibacillus koleovorans TaxID=121608 RepID=UPI000FDB2494|nr:sensor histidine kinase [Paenibacillus koleovorans]
MKLILFHAKSIKWQLLGYFGLLLLLPVAGLAAARLFGVDILSEATWLESFAVLLFVVLFGAYLIASQFQRKLDSLHLAILQLSRGNLAERIKPLGLDPFDRLYDDFNEMAKSLEKRMQLLQKVGEENVMLLAESNEVAVTEERKRLARDLHDTVSQQLFAIHMSASSSAKLLERGDHDKAQTILKQLVELSELTQKQLRGLLAQLRPIELEGKRLAEALDKWFPDYCRYNGLQGRMDLRVDRNIMSEAMEHQLFLIIQEGMANVVKHASAQHVELLIHDNGNQYVLQIGDDGKGFSNAGSGERNHSYGLTTMRERALKLGGELEIASKAGAGTRVKVYMPKFKPEETVAKETKEPKEPKDAKEPEHDDENSHRG